MNKINISKLNKFLEGNLVSLREVSYNDIDDIISWRNDIELSLYLNSPEKLTYETQFKYLEKYFKKNEYYFIIELKNSAIKIGTVYVLMKWVFFQ